MKRKTFKIEKNLKFVKSVIVFTETSPLSKSFINKMIYYYTVKLNKFSRSSIGFKRCKTVLKISNSSIFFIFTIIYTVFSTFFLL